MLRANINSDENTRPAHATFYNASTAQNENVPVDYDEPAEFTTARDERIKVCSVRADGLV